MMHWSNYSKYAVLISLAQNAVAEVREAHLARGAAVGAVLRAEEPVLGGDEEPREVGVDLVVVAAAIEVEDAAHRVALVADAEDAEEDSASTLISMRCPCRSRDCISAWRSFHTFTYSAPLPSLNTSWTQQMAAAVPYKAYQVG